MTGAPMPVADKFRLESRIAPHGFSAARMRGGGPAEWRGRGRPNQPARFGGAGFGLGVETQEKRRHAALLSRQHQPAARGKIEDPRRSLDFEYQRAKRRTGQRVEARAQRGGHIGRAQQEKAIGIEPQLQDARRRNLAMLQRGEVRPEPQDAFAFGGACGQSHGEPGRRRLVTSYGWKNLMQRAFEQPPTQAGISPGVPQRHARLPMHIREPRPGQAIPQKGNFVRRRIHGRPA